MPPSGTLLAQLDSSHCGTLHAEDRSLSAIIEIPARKNERLPEDEQDQRFAARAVSICCMARCQDLRCRLRVKTHRGHFVCFQCEPDKSFISFVYLCFLPPSGVGDDGSKLVRPARHPFGT